MTKDTLKCPVCGFDRLIDTNKAIVTEAYKVGEYPFRVMKCFCKGKGKYNVGNKDKGTARTIQ